MKLGVTFWAQALDNVSPDAIEFSGETLAPDDSARRQKVVSSVSLTVRNGREIFDSDGVRLIVDRQHFVMEVNSAERDQAGRIAPIVCFGHYDQGDVGSISSEVSLGLAAFAKQIGRNIESAQHEAILASFAQLKKKLPWSARFMTLIAGLPAQILKLLMRLIGSTIK